jgi:hypothetical protein
MPLKQDRTSYNVSNNLKSAFQGAGYNTDIKEGNTYYDGGASEIHLALFMLPDGSFRTVANTSTFADIVQPNDASFVRMWVESELAIAIAQVPGVEASESVFNSPNWVHTITFNGTAQTGTDSKKVDAMAKALIKCLDLL